MTYPTPTGNAPNATQFVTGETGNFNTDLNAILAQMRAQGYNQLANQFASFAHSYHAQHPQFTARQVLQAYLDSLLGNALGKGLGGTTAALGKIPAAAAQGAANAYNDIFGRFNLGNWVLRIGEILLGLVLVGVGIARMTGVQNKISELVKTKIPI